MKKSITMSIHITNHFKTQFEARVKQYPDLIAYLNQTLTEATLIKDPQYKGLYFHNAAVYIPIVLNENKLYAKTIKFSQFSMLNRQEQKQVNVTWEDICLK